MDHRMPIKNGIEAAKEILKLSPDIKIIFASADKSIRDTLKSMGIEHFFLKPFDIEVFVNYIIKLFNLAIP